jgi:hypothetical protein
MPFRSRSPMRPIRRQALKPFLFFFVLTIVQFSTCFHLTSVFTLQASTSPPPSDPPLSMADKLAKLKEKNAVPQQPPGPPLCEEMADKLAKFKAKKAALARQPPPVTAHILAREERYESNATTQSTLRGELRVFCTTAQHLTPQDNSCLGRGYARIILSWSRSTSDLSRLTI